MNIKLPELPYKSNALEPYISSETIDFHYGKHHKAYVTNLNNLISDTEFLGNSLEDIIKTSTGNIFNNASQVWNHSFYWNCLSPSGGGEPNGHLMDQIQKSFGSFINFKKQFTQTAITTFGSGWAWLVKNAQNDLELVSTSNADTPLTNYYLNPLLTCDVWEHAYYIDYRNARPKYIEAFWHLVNWDFVQGNLEKQ